MMVIYLRNGEISINEPSVGISVAFCPALQSLGDRLSNTVPFESRTMACPTI